MPPDLVTFLDDLFVPGEPPDRPVVVSLGPRLVVAALTPWRGPQPHEALSAGAQEVTGVCVIAEVLCVVSHKSAHFQQPRTVITVCGDITFAERLKNQQFLENVRHEWVQTHQAHVLKKLEDIFI